MMQTSDQATSTQTADQAPSEFESVRARLEEISDAVADEDLPLDDALALFEEAVNLGLKVSDLLEDDIAPEEADAAAGPIAGADGPDSGPNEGTPDPA